MYKEIVTLGPIHPNEYNWYGHLYEAKLWPVKKIYHPLRGTHKLLPHEQKHLIRLYDACRMYCHLNHMDEIERTVWLQNEVYSLSDWWNHVNDELGWPQLYPVPAQDVVDVSFGMLTDVHKRRIGEAGYVLSFFTLKSTGLLRKHLG